MAFLRQFQEPLNCKIQVSFDVFLLQYSGIFAIWLAFVNSMRIFFDTVLGMPPWHLFLHDADSYPVDEPVKKISTPRSSQLGELIPIFWPLKPTNPFCSSIKAQLKEYWKTYWGKELPENLTKLPSGATDTRSVGEGQDIEMETLINELDGDLIPDAEPISGSLIDLPKTKLLVRGDYIRVYDAINTFSKTPVNLCRLAAIITGQPGIGKFSIFLSIFALITLFDLGKSIWIHYGIRRWLGLSLPTIWYQKDGIFLFDKFGVSKVHDLFAVPESCWCFIDSSESTEGIPSRMTSASFKGFPIYVSSPTELRWKRLYQSMLVEVFLMNPWTWQEIVHTWVFEIGAA